jgi:ATP-dependent 26S proteasome regulatory subunit
LPASPAGEPILDGIDWDFLSARLELTGAQIKAIALGAAFLARSEERLIGMRHVIAATQREMTKNGSMLRLPLQQVAR